MFLKAVDCEGQVKDSEFISCILIDVIESVGLDNVVQVVTNNAKVCRATGIIVESRYDHIFWTSCTIHSLNLVMKSIHTETNWVKKIYQEAEEIQMLVTNRHRSQAIFRSFSDLELLKVASSSAVERNWSTCSFIHSVKRNRLAAKKAEDLVFIHNNLGLLSRKDPKYKKGHEKLWDVALEKLDLDLTIRNLARSTLLDVDDDENDYEFTIPSTTSGGGLGSSGDTDIALAAHQYPSDADFLENSFDD